MYISILNHSATEVDRYGVSIMGGKMIYDTADGKSHAEEAEEVNGVFRDVLPLMVVYADEIGTQTQEASGAVIFYDDNEKGRCATFATFGTAPQVVPVAHLRSIEEVTA